MRNRIKIYHKVFLFDDSFFSAFYYFYFSSLSILAWAYFYFASFSYSCIFFINCLSFTLTNIMYRMKRTALIMAQPYIRSMIAVYYCFFSVSLGYGSALTGGPITYMLYIFLLMNIRDRNVRIITLGAIMRLSRDYLSGWSSTRS